MSTLSMKRFRRKRREALLSLDARKIREYAAEYGVPLPSSVVAFWAGVHKARCECSDLPDEARELSRKWLLERGLYLGIGLSHAQADGPRRAGEP